MPCRFLVADRSGCSFVWEYSSGGHQSREIVEPDGSRTLVCTNHPLHRWPTTTSAGELCDPIGSGLPHDWVSDLAPGEVVPERDHVIQFDMAWLRSCQAVMPELREIDPLIRQSARGLVFDGNARAAAAEEIRRVVRSRGAERLVHMLRLLVVLNDATDERRPLAGEWFVNAGDRNSRVAVEAGISYIFDNLEGDVTLSTAARLAHMSDSAFSRYFKNASGLTFSAMVRKLRIANACRLLEAGDLAVSAVASTTGYHNLANFNRQFRAETGMTPRDYRRSHGERLRDKLRPPTSTSERARAAVDGFAVARGEHPRPSTTT